MSGRRKAETVFPPLRSQREIDRGIALARIAGWLPLAAAVTFLALQAPAAFQKALWDAAWAQEIIEGSRDG